MPLLAEALALLDDGPFIMESLAGASNSERIAKAAIYEKLGPVSVQDTLRER